MRGEDAGDKVILELFELVLLLLWLFHTAIVGLTAGENVPVGMAPALGLLGVVVYVVLWLCPPVDWLIFKSSSTRL